MLKMNYFENEYKQINPIEQSIKMKRKVKRIIEKKKSQVEIRMENRWKLRDILSSL